MREEKFLVFVYGSLKQGGALHYILEGHGTEFAGAARTVADYTLYDVSSFPGMVAELNGAGVEGEVYRVTAETLRGLDRAEGEGSMYHRREVELHPDARPEGVEKVWAYLWAYEVRPDRHLGAAWDVTRWPAYQPPGARHTPPAPPAPPARRPLTDAEFRTEVLACLMFTYDQPASAVGAAYDEFPTEILPGEAEATTLRSWAETTDPDDPVELAAAAIVEWLAGEYDGAPEVPEALQAALS